MKKALMLLLATAVAFAAASSVTVNFSYDFTGETPCSPTLQADCIDHFEVGTYYQSVFVGKASVPAPASPSGVTSLSGTFPLAKYGAVPIAVVSVARDSAGAFVYGFVQTEPFRIVPGVPNVLTITAQ